MKNNTKARMARSFVLALVLVVALFAAGYANPTYAYNRPSYYGQYDYRYNSVLGSPYVPVNAWGRPSQPYYMAYGGTGPSLYAGSPSYNPFLGYSYTYDSHMNVRNKLDYQYYTHPDLLAPRRMDNHQRYVKGLWPQGFAY